MKLIKYIFISVFFCGPVYAQNSDYAVSFLTIKTTTREARRESAVKMHRQVLFLQDIVPTQRPAELEWLNTERKAIENSTNVGSERLLLLNNSIEYNHFNFLTKLSNIRTSLECIIKDGVTLKREVYCWGLAIQNLNKRESFENETKLLRAAGRLSKKHLFNTKIDAPNEYSEVALYYGLAADSIFEGIVMPYLSEELK